MATLFVGEESSRSFLGFDVAVPTNKVKETCGERDNENNTDHDASDRTWWEACVVPGACCASAG